MQSLVVKITASSVASLLLLAVQPAQADVIYAQGQAAAINGGLSGHNPFSQANNFVAQDFSVTGNWLLQSITYNAWTTASSVPVTDFWANIYADNAGTIGSLLYSTHISGSNSGVVTGFQNGYTLRDYSFDVGSDVALGTGNYWLALHADPAQWDVHWTIPSLATIGHTSYISRDFGQSYTGYNFEHTFRLEGVAANTVPEPLTLGLVVTGLLALGLSQRRQA